MANSIKVSFEITDNYDIGSFRNFIKKLLSEDDLYELYIISNDDSSTDINNVANSLGLDNNHVIICNFTNDKITAINNNGIQVHFDNLQSFVMLVDETTEAYGVLVTPWLNRYYLESDFIITFNSIVKRIRNDEEKP